MSICYLCWGVTEVYIATLRSTGKVFISTALNTLAFSVNVLLNAVFIFGLLGAPKLGAAGVAIATSLSRLTELLACFAVSATGRYIRLDLRYLFVRDKALFSDFIRLSLPALGNDVAWGTAFSMYSVIIGHLGTDAVAANSFVIVVRNFGTVLCFGAASAGGILLGNIIGENKMEEAMKLQYTINSIIYKLCAAHGNMYGVIKAVLRINEELELGSVRARLAALVESDMPVVEEAARMIRAARAKYF